MKVNHAGSARARAAAVHRMRMQNSVVSAGLMGATVWQIDLLWGSADMQDSNQIRSSWVCCAPAGHACIAAHGGRSAGVALRGVRWE